MVKDKRQRPNNPNDAVRRSKCLATADEQSAVSGIGARCSVTETTFATLGQQGARWPLLGTCEVEEFSIPRRKVWGTGHGVGNCGCGKAGEREQGSQVEEKSKFGGGVGGDGVLAWRSLYTVDVIQSIYPRSCPLRRSRT